jgi:DNA mismatch endonuclease (patch repair protein)
MEIALKHKLRSGIFSGIDPARSKIMSAIRGQGNKSTEIQLKRAMLRLGLRHWISHPKNIFGRPDFYFPKQKLAIFVDGCFWHGCPTCGHIPKTRSAFWKEKFIRNNMRRIVVRRFLQKLSIRATCIWEHNLKTATNADKQAKKVLRLLNGLRHATSGPISRLKR